MRNAPLLLSLALASGLAAAVTGCDSGQGPPPALPEIPDDKPIARLTAAQYNNAARDLFPQANLRKVDLPYELSIGAFNNNVEVTTATSTLVEAYHTAARSISRDVMASLDQVLPCTRGEQACGHQYLTDLAARAYRRPLTEQERSELIADFDGWLQPQGFDAALELSIQLILQSPPTIYFVEQGGTTNANGDIALTSWQVASRLSFFLWNTLPDAELRQLAAEDRLTDPAVIAAQAQRMMGDARAHESVARFHRQLFDLDKIGNNGLDPDAHPYVTERFEGGDIFDIIHIDIQPRMRWETEIFVDQTVFYGAGNLRALLTSNRTWVSESFGWVYGPEGEQPTGDGVLWPFALGSDGESQGESELGEAFYPVDLNPAERAGVLTQLGFLHSHANPKQPSPVHRGVFVIDRLLCRALTAPTDVPALEDTNQGREPKTNRERYAIHTESPACASCHIQIDGIGFAFEGYDSLGRIRTEDGGYPVDTSGELVGTDQDGAVKDAVDLAHRLGNSRTVHDCYTKQWFRYAFGRKETKADEPYLAALSEGFWKADGNVRELMINLAASYAFRHRRAR